MTDYRARAGDIRRRLALGEPVESVAAAHGLTPKGVRIVLLRDEREVAQEARAAEAWDALMQALRRVSPDHHALSYLWQEMHEEFAPARRYPEWASVLQVILAWWNGRANDHMTVLRLRRLTEAKK